MGRKGLGILLAGLGLALAVVSALADAWDIGQSGFGWKQIAGVIVGVLAVLVGGFLVQREPGSSTPSTREP